MYGCANDAEVELKLTMTPRPQSSNAGNAARVIKNVPVRLMLMTWFHMSSVHSCV